MAVDDDDNEADEGEHKREVHGRESPQRIEREMGRTLKSDGGEYHDRIIDIDILLYGDLHIDEPDLKIPHPLMHERDFVMTPLNEIMEE